MVTVVSGIDSVSVPDWVVDLESFRRWMDSDDLPEEYRVWYLNGEVWVDMSKEQLFTHVAVKHEVGYTLTGIIKAGKLGRFFADGTRLSNVEADVSGNPGGAFVSTESLREGRVRLIEGVEGGYVELEGSPDMVLEVVSDGSVHKDTVLLRRAYWEAGVREYWIVDARDGIRFDLFKRSAKGYVAARKQGGWVKSAVFGKSFRLTQGADNLGHPEFTLEVR